MLKKASFDSLSARVVGFDLDFTTKDTDFNTYGYFPGQISRYALITTEDPHNFSPGYGVTINGLYSTLKNTPFTQVALVLENVQIAKIVNANSFVIKCPVTHSTGFFDVAVYDYYLYPGSSHYSTPIVWNNPFVTAYQNNGNLGAYHIVYGKS